MEGVEFSFCFLAVGENSKSTKKVNYIKSETKAEILKYHKTDINSYMWKKIVYIYTRSIYKLSNNYFLLKKQKPDRIYCLLFIDFV